MQRWWLALVLATCLLWSTDGTAQNRFAFGVRPNTLSPQAAYFGYMVADGIVVTGALQYLGGGVDISYSDYDDWEDDYVTRSNDADAAIWIPSVGIKYYLKSIDVGVAPYLHASLFTAIPTADGDDGLEAAVDDASCYGLGLAFGAEYFMHKQFSIGAEFGLNVVVASYDAGRDEASIDLEATYAAMSLNFFL